AGRLSQRHVPEARREAERLRPRWRTRRKGSSRTTPRTRVVARTRASGEGTQRLSLAKAGGRRSIWPPETLGSERTGWSAPAGVGRGAAPVQPGRTAWGTAGSDAPRGAW